MYKATYIPQSNTLKINFATVLIRNLCTFQIKKKMFSGLWDANWNVMRVLIHFYLMNISTCKYCKLSLNSVFCKCSYSESQLNVNKNNWIYDLQNPFSYVLYYKYIERQRADMSCKYSEAVFLPSLCSISYLVSVFILKWFTVLNNVWQWWKKL